MKENKTCLHCQQDFIPTRSDAKYCCVRCRWNAWAERKQTGNNFGTDKEQTKNNMRTDKNQTAMRVHPAAISLLTNATWEFAHNMLWNGQHFNEIETEIAKHHIREYYDNIPAELFTLVADRHFSAYCERILLARDYVNRFPHRYIPHPCIWLNKHNPKGFAGTKSWYLRNMQKRERQSRLSGICRCAEYHLPDYFISHYRFTA